MMRIVELDGEKESRRDTEICLIDTIKRGKEVSVTQWRMMKLWASDHVFLLSSLVSRVKTGQPSHVATMANIETGGGGGVVSSRKCPCYPAPRTKH